MWRAGDGICRQLLVFFAGKHHSKIITRLRHFIQDTFLLSKEENNADWHQRAEFKVPTKQELENHTVKFQVSEPKALQCWNHWAWDNSCCKQPFFTGLRTFSSVHSLFSPRSSSATNVHPQGFYSQGRAWAGILPNLGSHWHYAGKKRENLPRQSHWQAKLPWQLPSVLGSSKTPGELGKGRICAGFGSGAGRGALYSSTRQWRWRCHLLLAGWIAAKEAPGRFPPGFLALCGCRVCVMDIHRRHACVGYI